MKTLVIGIHGFNSDGEYINQLAPYFVKAGYDYQPFIYGKAARTTVGNIIMNRWRTKRIFNDLAQLVINCKYEKVILVGHSHGLRLAWAVQNVCNKVIGVVSFNGALNRDTTFRSWILNYYCPTDFILKLARFRPFSRWGDYGSRENEGAVNIDLSNFNVKGHSDFLDNLKSIMPNVMARIEAQIAA